MVAGSVVIALLPIVAIIRGSAAALAQAARAGLGVTVLGLTFALLALMMGALFFAYSMKYYLGTAITLLLAFFGPGRNGHGSGGKTHANGFARIIRRSTNGNGHAANGNGNGNGHVDLGYDPFVSIHIATYNEKRVVERLLEACANLNYGNYEVILIDDSTDGSAQILKPWESRPGFKIIHRATRDGFKGGALKQALKVTDPRAEYVVIFDADAVPFPDVIRDLLSHFYTNGSQPPRPLAEIGAVQSYQWHILNKSESWLTEAVRTEYAGSYMVERPFQQVLGSMKMIAGTSYMIRAKLLRELGWGRSLTEDWELTLRLYARGYKVAYTPYAETPAECVATFGRLVRQRMRWAEGHTYNVRKWFKTIMTSPNLRPVEKAEFAYYALYYLQSVLLVVGSLAWLLSELVFRVRVPEWTALLGWSLLFSNLLSLPLMNVGGLLLEGSPAKDYGGVVGALALSFLLVPFQGWAALRGLIERDEGPWYRTPKTGRITDRIENMPRRKGLRRWLTGTLKQPSTDGRSLAAAAQQPPTRRRRSSRLGWTLVAAMTLTLIGLVVGAVGAPTAHASPDQLYLRDTTLVNSSRLLGIEGVGRGSGLLFQDGSTSWISPIVYGALPVAAGTYAFTFYWESSQCGTGGNSCTVVVSWGFFSNCNLVTQTCATLQQLFAFPQTKITAPGSGSRTISATEPQFTLTSCPCALFLTITTANNEWTLDYSGSVDLVTGRHYDTNILTPVLPVPERLLPLAWLSVLIPVVALSRVRRLRR